ncbi:hypothetical protein A6R68_22010, partial [Neotoma lepida]
MTNLNGTTAPSYYYYCRPSFGVCRFSLSNMLENAELYFNVDHGYLEGLVRGCKASLLTQQDYVNLVQCETLE